MGVAGDQRNTGQAAAGDEVAEARQSAGVDLPGRDLHAEDLAVLVGVDTCRDHDPSR